MQPSACIAPEAGLRMVALFSADEILLLTHGRIAAGGTNDHKGRLVWNKGI